MQLRLQIFFVVLYFCGHNDVEGRFIFNRTHLVESVKSVVTGVVSGVGRQMSQGLPRPRDLLSASKQVFIGLPEIAVFGTIHQISKSDEWFSSYVKQKSQKRDKFPYTILTNFKSIYLDDFFLTDITFPGGFIPNRLWLSHSDIEDFSSSVYLASDKINPRILPEIKEMSFQLRTPCHAESFPIQKAEGILQSPHFDVNKKVVLFVSGWTSTIESDSIAHLAKAYNCRGDYNFLALNASYFIDTLYTWSAFNTEEMGRIVAVGLQLLHKQIPAENFHLIGFSLGAHILGSAGRYFKQWTGTSIARITGLDPANPCFNEGETLTGLQRGDADFVDVIHTNPGGLGKRDPLGDIDFYAGGFTNVKPGCTLFSCSHQRAWRYYAESVYPGHESDFMATRCNSLRKVDNGQCKSVEVPMGFDVPVNEKGLYVVGVKPKTPYGRNANVYNDIIMSDCGLCSSDQ